MLQSLLSKLVKNGRQGSILPYFILIFPAIIMPVFVMVLDMGGILALERNIQRIADTSALTAAVQVFNGKNASEIKDYAEQFLADEYQYINNLNNVQLNITANIKNVTPTNNLASVTVNISVPYTYRFGHFVRLSNKNISVISNPLIQYNPVASGNKKYFLR